MECKLDLTDYKHYLIRKGCKPSTIKRRLWNLANVLKHAEWTYESVDDWLFSMLETHKAKYLNSIIDSIRTYATFSGADERLAKYQDFKEEPTVKSTMSDEEIEAFLALPCPERRAVSPYGKVFYRRSNPKEWERWQMFWELLFYSGARPNEIAKLDADRDILWGQGCIMVNNDKTGHNRLIPIAPNIAPHLKDYCSNIPAIPSGRRYLFAAKNSTGFFNSVSWCERFHERLRRLGITRQGLTCYSARHSFITSMLENDVNIFKVQKIVGHRRLETTNINTHMTTKDIKAAIKKLPLVQKNADPHIALASFKEAIRDLCIDKDNRFTYNLEESPEKIVLRIELK